MHRIYKTLTVGVVALTASACLQYAGPAPGPAPGVEHPVPAGQPHRVGDWTIRVTGWQPAAWPQISEGIDTDYFVLEPPPPGRRYGLARVKVRYEGAGVADPAYELTFQATPLDGPEQGNLTDECSGWFSRQSGVLPDRLAGGMTTGAEKTGVVCLEWPRYKGRDPATQPAAMYVSEGWAGTGSAFFELAPASG